jgi:uncharacterized protein YciI
MYVFVRANAIGWVRRPPPGKLVADAARNCPPIGPAWTAKVSRRAQVSAHGESKMDKRLFVILAAVAAALLTGAPVRAGEAGTPAGQPEHHMKKYFFVLLRRGTNHSQSKEEAEKIQEGHMAHLRETAQSGQLQIAGPFDDDKADWRGILIYDVATFDEARRLCEADPAVKAGRLVCDIHAWWSQTGATLK